VRPVAARGRRLWGLAGLATAASLAIPGGWLITSAGMPAHGLAQRDAVTRVIVVRQPVTTLTVQSDGAPVKVTAGPVHRVRVTETILYDPQGGGPPVVPQTVSRGILTLAGPQCDCWVSFAVTVPPGLGVAVNTEGGSIAVSGVTGANLDSGGGPVRATRISGHLIVTTDDGAVAVSGLTGPLDADTGGGPLLASGVDTATATVVTSGGQARIGFAAAPEAVFVSTGGGAVALTVPGGPYALTASTYGGSDAVRIVTSPSAGRSITVTTGGGPLRIEPPRAAG
jgi:hypothetical protein